MKTTHGGTLFGNTPNRHTKGRVQRGFCMSSMGRGHALGLSKSQLCAHAPSLALRVACANCATPVCTVCVDSARTAQKLCATGLHENTASPLTLFQLTRDREPRDSDLVSLRVCPKLRARYTGYLRRLVRTRASARVHPRPSPSL